jgi:hypothetical protein
MCIKNIYTKYLNKSQLINFCFKKVLFYIIVYKIKKLSILKNIFKKMKKISLI